MQYKSWVFVIFLLFFISYALAQTSEEKALPTTFSGIPQAPEPPVIDGDLGEWSLASAIFVSDKSIQPLDDCSGVFYMMWDEENLYLTAKVYDDDLVQGKSGSSIWQEDDVQFDLDLDRNGDKNIATYNDDDFQTGFSPGDFNKEEPEIWGWNPGGGKAMGRPENAEIESSKFDGGWIIEARIGIDEFNADLIKLKKFEEGMKIGFGRCINDYDKDGEGGVSSGGAWNDTTKMYDVEFVGPLSVEAYLKHAILWGSIKRIF